MIGTLLEAFNVSLGTWAILFAIAWYLFRGARAGKKAGSVLGRAVTYAVLILISFGAASMLGYASLDIGHFLADAGAAIAWAAKNAAPMLRDLISGVI